MTLPDKKQQIDWDRFPGTLENPSDFRKSSGDYGVTFSVPVKHVGYIQPLMEKAQRTFAVFIIPAADMEQAENLIKQQDIDPDIMGLPDPSYSPLTKGGDGGCFVPVEVIAEVLVMTERNAQLQAEKGLLIRGTRGQYDTLASCAALWKALKEAENGRSDGYHHERTEAMRLKRQTKEVEYLEKVGQLVNADAARKLVEKVLAQMRQRILMMPKYLAPILDGLSAREQEPILENYARESLVDLAAPDLSGAADSAGLPDHGTPAEAHPKPVGGRKKKARKQNKR
jgi:hypothetical protein